MNTTTDFFNWFYSGLSGLGGWFIFFLLAAIAIIVILYDSSRRHLPATGWKMGVILVSCLLIPAIIYRFSSLDTRLSIAQFAEGIFYLGLLGGVIPPVLAAGYFVTFRGQVVCPRGHVYDGESLKACPECARIDAANRPVVVQAFQQNFPPAQPAQVPVQQQPQPPQYVKPAKPKSNAWLVGSGHNYQLCRGETTLGRTSANDIQLTGDETVSRQHAKITEANGHYRLYDLGSANGTFVNGHRVREPMMLEHGDDVRLGDSLTLKFTSGQ
jgi:hypothetical protein